MSVFTVSIFIDLIVDCWHYTLYTFSRKLFLVKTVDDKVCAESRQGHYIWKDTEPNKQLLFLELKNEKVKLKEFGSMFLSLFHYCI